MPAVLNEFSLQKEKIIFKNQLWTQLLSAYFFKERFFRFKIVLKTKNVEVSILIFLLIKE